MGFLTQEARHLDVNSNVALDGFSPSHDRIRGVPSNFEKTDGQECPSYLH